MEMHQVIYFRALSEELNFTRAARRCNVSQPSLTRAIRLLEEEFGGVLFHRERNHTHLSELGHIIKPHLDQVFEETEAAAQKARGFRELTKIRLKLGIMCTIAPTDLIELLSGVRTRHPGIHLEINDAAADEVEEDLKRGELEIAILSKPGDEREPFLHYLPLYREPFVIAVNPSHPLAQRDELRVVDLKGTPSLRRVKCEFGEFSGREFRHQGLANEIVYQSDRDDWILAMAAAGMGYAFMPERSVGHRQVVAKKLVAPEFFREVSLVTVRGRPHSPAVGALVQETMRATWMNGRALAVRQLGTRPPPEAPESELSD